MYRLKIPYQLISFNIHINSLQVSRDILDRHEVNEGMDSYQ